MTRSTSSHRTLPLSALRSRLSARHRRGLGLAELLIALAICASLLTAVGVALDASFKSYKINQEQSALTQRARLTLHRVLTTIRQCDAHAPATGSLSDEFASGQIVDDDGIAMIDDDGHEIVFKYDSINQRILMVRDDVERTLTEGVTQFEVTLEPMRSPTAIRTGAPFDLLHRATLLITVRLSGDTAMSSESTGNQSVTISSSVMPRRNVW